MILRHVSWALALGAAIAPGRGRAESGDPSAGPGDDRHARVSSLEGDARRQGPFHNEDELLSLNDLVREQDVIATDPGARVEIEIAGGVFVRLTGTTHVAVEKLADEVHLNLLRGSIYLSRGSGARPVGVTAASRRIDVDQDSVARAEYDPDRDRLVVHVDAGHAEVRDAGSRYTLQAGRSAEFIARENNLGAERSLNDTFARWHQERELLVRSYAPPEHVEGEPLGLYDLESNGRWIYVTGQWAWDPHVHADWRPYRDGDWVWIAPYGWTWIPAARWGYVTHHYGRWYWASGYGWVWLPGHVWGPGWVVWARFGGFVGWAPMDIYGRPIIVHSSWSYYDPAAWCFARRSYFKDRHRVRRVRHRHQERTGSPHERRRGPPRGRMPEILTFAGEKLRRLRPEPMSVTGPMIEPVRRARTIPSDGSIRPVGLATPVRKASSLEPSSGARSGPEVSPRPRDVRRTSARPTRRTRSPSPPTTSHAAPVRVLRPPLPQAERREVRRAPPGKSTPGRVAPRVRVAPPAKKAGRQPRAARPAPKGTVPNLGKKRALRPQSGSSPIHRKPDPRRSLRRGGARK